ncbi:hypothetical protein BH09MYX1_BH09MYX1_11450 [soil metagenome]
MLSIAASCSSDGTAPLDEATSQSQAFTGCGTPLAISATTDATPTSQSFANTPLYVPSSVQATGAMWYANSRITATLALGSATTCTYESVVRQATPVDLAFVSCNDGSVPGTTRIVTGLTLSGTMNGFFGYATLQVSVPKSIDDLVFCTTDSCNGVGQVVNTPRPLGTACDDGQVCNGPDACNGGIQCLPTMAQPPTAAFSDGNDCTSDTCPATTIIHTPIPGCGAPPPGASGGAQDPTVPTSYASSVSFLYTGGTQTGMSATIDPIRASVVRGRVFVADGVTGLSGATVRIAGHTEFGQTLTRSDGFYDLVVNGGDSFVVEVLKSGYLTSQRHVATRWHDYAVAGDISLVARDTAVNPTVTLGSGSWQVVRGTPTTHALDPDQPTGTTRTATLLFQPGTTVTTAGFTGSSLTVRQTEYTVGGTKGMKAMPAELPPTSAYTYAAEFSADEAEAQGLTSITFNKPAYFYVENFTGTSYDGTGVNSNVPTGSYDRVTGAWKPESNGIILKVVANTGTSVDLSLDGTTPMSLSQYTTYGIDPNERAKLAPLYPVGTSLWRTPVIHFSPWDLNWAAGIAADAMPPPDAPPRVDTPRPDPCEVHGSVVECENQTLRESVPIVGTPFSLVYSSARQAGSLPTVNIPLSDGRAIPTTLLRMEADVTAAGRRATYVFPAATNQSVQWTWDRKDPYGNLVQGSVQATVDVRYVYAPTATRATASFGAVAGSSSVGGNRAAREITLTRQYAFKLDAFDAKGLGLGGWQLDAMQVWDPSIGLVLGTRTTPIDAVTLFYSKSPVSGSLIQGIAVGGDGSVYTGAYETGAFPYGAWGVLRISSGVRTAISNGSGCTGAALFPNGTALASVCVGSQFSRVAATSSGGLLIGDDTRILRVGASGSRPASVIAGGGATPPVSGQPARGTSLAGLFAVAEAPDGSVVVGTAPGSAIGRVWRIAGDGKLELLGGDGTLGTPAASCVSTPDSCSAVGQHLGSVTALAVDPAGNVYIASGLRIWRISTQGKLRHVAGDGTSGGSTNDGLPATQVPLPNVKGLAYRDGWLYVADSLKHLIRRIGSDGVIRTIAGDPTDTAPGLTGTATTSRLTGPGGNGPNGFAFGPDGSIYIATDWDNHGILRMSPPLPTTSAGATLVPSPDGSEVYEFASDGRHMKTRTPDGGKPKYTFAYTGGKLSSITDAGGNVTTISYGATVTIGSPRSGNTLLALDGNGYLASVTSPKTDEVILLQHSVSGLLQQLTDAKSQVHTFVHSATGRLTKDKNALNGTAGLRLGQTFTPNGWDVAVTTPEGRTTAHQISFSPATTNNGKRIELRTHASPLGLVSTEERYSDLGRKITYPDGTVVDLAYGADPRFGAASPYINSRKTASGGKSSTETIARTVSGLSPSDPFTFTSTKETRSFSATTADLRSPIEVVYTLGPPSTRTRTTTLGRQVVEQLDGSDRVTKVTIPGSVPGAGSSALIPVDFYYDGNGRLWKIDQNGGVAGSRTTTMTFASGKDWVSSVTSPLESYSYSNFDNVGRAQTVTLPNAGAALLLEYDRNGDNSKVTMPLAGSRVHLFSATPEDLLGIYTPPTATPGGATMQTYDRDDLLMSLLEPGAQAVYTRDDMGRVTSLSYPLPIGTTETVGREYDSSGRLWKLNDTSGPVNLTYTYSGQMVTKEAYTGLFTHDVNKTYDDYFRMTSRDIDAVASTKANFKYDQDGVLNEVNGGWGTYKIFRTSGSSSSPVNGMLTGTELGGPTGLTDAYQYDVFGALKRYTLSFAGSARYDVQYGRDSQGRVLTKTEMVWGLNGNASCSTTYGYTSGRLTADNGNCPWGYAGPTPYDADGNIYGPSSWTYDLQDRIISDGSWTYTHNGDGDVVNEATGSNQWQFDFDMFGNLRRFYNPLYSPGSYPYRAFAVDGRNRRVGFLDNGAVVSQMLYDGDRVVAMNRGGSMGHFVYGTKQHVPDLLLRPDGAYRVVSDQLGSVKLVIKTDGTVVESRNYNAWGIPVWTAATNGGTDLWKFVPFGFAGGLWDEYSNLVRFGARDYNPWAARWWSKDPSRFGGGVNFYAYANNDPVNYVDPNGREPEPADGYGPGSTIPDFLCVATGICIPRETSDGSGAQSLQRVSARPCAAGDSCPKDGVGSGICNTDLSTTCTYRCEGEMGFSVSVPKSKQAAGGCKYKSETHDGKYCPASWPKQ